MTLNFYLPTSNSWIQFWDRRYEPHLVSGMLSMEPKLCAARQALYRLTLTLTPALAWLAYFVLFPIGEAEEANGDFAPVEQAA